MRSGLQVAYGPIACSHWLTVLMLDESLVTSYREFAPPPDLAAYVACTWVNFSRAQSQAPSQPIIPDGCADIVMFGDDPPHVAGPAATTQWVQPPPAGTLITAIRFRPGAVRSILRCDVEALGPWGAELEFDLRAPGEGLGRRTRGRRARPTYAGRPWRPGHAGESRQRRARTERSSRQAPC